MSDSSFFDVDLMFREQYSCLPVVKLPGNERDNVEFGGKIIMPPSALDALTQMNVEYPMLFKLSNHMEHRTTHTGVLEFVAEEGTCQLPEWMMRNLLLVEGDTIVIENVSLPVATFSRFQPQSTDFLDITNPKAVLENSLRNFACLTVGDVIAIKYNIKVYELSVLETKPGNAISIIECDMNVEFEAPVGYEPVKSASQQLAQQAQDPYEEEADDGFPGTGSRLDGKTNKNRQKDAPVNRQLRPRGIPDYDYQVGTLTFDRSVRPNNERESNQQDGAPDPNGFQGAGYSLQ